MAKPARVQVRLVSEEGTGYFYIAQKNPTQKPEKMSVRKYDARRESMFSSASTR